MNQIIYVTGSRRDEILLDAVRRDEQVVLTHRVKHGWSVEKSCFVGGSPEEGRLLLREPSNGKSHASKLMASELMGVAFRRGHKKCMFSAPVTEVSLSTADGVSRGAFAVAWPEGLQELQRRVYQRATPPVDRPITVTYCRAAGATNQANASPGNPNNAGTGRMLDVSAGGIRILCTGNHDFELGEDVTVMFAMGSRGNEFRIPAQFRHCDELGDGESAIAFQFVGLETSEQGRQTLGHLARIVTGFHRSATRRGPSARHARHRS